MYNFNIFKGGGGGGCGEPNDDNSKIPWNSTKGKGSISNLDFNNSLTDY